MANLPTNPNYFPSFCPYNGIFTLGTVETLEVNQLDFKKLYGDILWGNIQGLR